MIGIDHAFAASRTNIVQNIPYLDSFFSECVESTVFCDGSTRGSKSIANTGLLLRAPKANQPKTLVLAVFSQDKM